MKIVRGALYFIAFLNLLVLAGLAYWGYSNLRTGTKNNVVVGIPRGTSVRDVAALLEHNGAIRDRFFFEAYVRLSRKSSRLKAGEYEFSAGDNLQTVVDKLLRGDTKKYTFTLPEGHNVRELCRALIPRGLNLITCLELISDTGQIKEKPAGARTLEGYLFPETYTFDAFTTPETFISSMVDMFYKKIGPDREAKAKALGFTLHQLVTLASVVEKETGRPDERPMIAAVFLNRLKRGMPLQSDPTVIYGIDPFNGNLTKADLQRDAPHNTYTRPGLPVGPICSPGLAAIDSVLNPASTGALYFVAKGDGSHYFSSSLEEHNRAVSHYQRGHDAPPSPAAP